MLLIITALLAGTAWGLRFVLGARLSLSIIWLSVWAAATLLTGLFGSVYDMDADRVWLLLVLFALPLGEVLAHISRGKKLAPAPEERRFFFVVSKHIVLLQCIGICAGLAGVILMSTSLGGSITDLSAGAARSNARLIFTGEADIPGIVKQAFMFLCLGTVLSGVYWGSSGGRWKWPLVMGLFAAALLWTLVTTQRSYLFVPIIWWLSGYLTARTFLGLDREILNTKVVLIGMFAVVSLAVLMVGVRSMRTDTPFLEDLSGAFDSSRAWFAGSIPAFLVWHDRWHGDTSFGALLANGVLSAMGSAEALDRFAEVQYIGYGQTTNALTLLRYLIGDFGVFGCGLFLALMGFSGGKLFESCRRGSPFATALLPSIIATAIWSPNSWFLGYGGRVSVGVVLVIGTVITSLWIRRPRVQSARARRMSRRSNAPTRSGIH
jgi:oligosaccharide repeat unit polymerase